MEKRKFFITTLLVVAAVSVAVVSCKKETPNALQNSTSQSVKTFAVPQVDDMNAYLKDFKKKMQTATRDGNETLSLEEAAWHLSSVANYDFANANVEFDDIRFDTLYSTINVTGGIILLNDLATTYENISTDIDEFYHRLTLNEKHFRFINTTISENGNIEIVLITTFKHNSRDIDDHLWFYPNLWDLQNECIYFFGEHISLPASTLGRKELERFLNWKVSNIAETRYYYTTSFYDEFYYRDEIDPYGSPNFINSRLFANNGSLDMDILPIIEYLCDSKLHLGYSNCPPDLYIICWKLLYELEKPFPHYHEHFWKEHYRMKVYYGERHEHIPESGNNYY